MSENNTANTAETSTKKRLGEKIGGGIEHLGVKTRNGIDKLVPWALGSLALFEGILTGKTWGDLQRFEGIKAQYTKDMKAFGDVGKKVAELAVNLPADTIDRIHDTMLLQGGAAVALGLMAIATHSMSERLHPQQIVQPNPAQPRI